MGNIRNSPARMSVWVEIPNGCRMRAEFADGDFGATDVHMRLGGEVDETVLRFERTALKRFVELAERMLGTEHAPGSPPRSILDSSAREGIQEVERS